MGLWGVPWYRILGCNGGCAALTPQNADCNRPNPNDYKIFRKISA